MDDKQELKRAYHKEYNARYREANPDRGRMYYQAHRTKLLSRSNAYNLTNHRQQCIRRWKRKGICLRPEETWDGVYDKYAATTHCESCEEELDDSNNNTHRCNDHSHVSPCFIRGTICNRCNKMDQWRKRMTPGSIYQTYQTYQLLTE